MPSLKLTDLAWYSPNINYSPNPRLATWPRGSSYLTTSTTSWHVPRWSLRVWTSMIFLVIKRVMAVDWQHLTPPCFKMHFSFFIICIWFSLPFFRFLFNTRLALTVRFSSILLFVKDYYERRIKWIRMICVRVREATMRSDMGFGRSNQVKLSLSLYTSVFGLSLVGFLVSFVYWFVCFYCCFSLFKLHQNDQDYFFKRPKTKRKHSLPILVPFHSSSLILQNGITVEYGGACNLHPVASLHALVCMWLKWSIYKYL